MGVASSGNAMEVSSPLTTHTQRSGFASRKSGACCLINEAQASRRAFMAVASSSATHGGKRSSSSANPAARFTQKHQIGTVFDSASGRDRPRRVASTRRAPSFDNTIRRNSRLSRLNESAHCPRWPSVLLKRATCFVETYQQPARAFATTGSGTFEASSVTKAASRAIDRSRLRSVPLTPNARRAWAAGDSV